MESMTKQRLLLLNIKSKLQKMGLKITPCKEQGYVFDISKDGEILGKITNTCDFFTNYEQYKKNILIIKIQQAVNNIKDGLNAYCASPNMVIDNIPLEAKHRIAEIGNILILGLLKDNNELEYSICEYSQDRKDLIYETITEDFDEAKQALLLRTNTKDLAREFTETEMKILRDGLVVAGDIIYEQGSEKQKEVNTLLDKIQNVIGEVYDAPSQQQEIRKEQTKHKVEEEEEEPEL
ncbi:MAG: hypothetical protein RR385_07450 [Clostridiales bacterium]